MSGAQITVIDGKGHVLVLHAPGDPLLTMDVLEAAGQDAKARPVMHLVTNQGWISMATVACHVETIDGVPVPTPTNVPQIKALVAQLGSSGMKAVSTAIGEAIDAADAEVAKN